MSNKRKRLLILLAVEAVILLCLVIIFSRTAKVEYEDEKIYPDASQVEEISCDDCLQVGKVTVSMPESEKVEYSISYSWGEDDTDYPTIPNAAVASCTSKDGAPVYDISLYRDSFSEDSVIPPGKTADNWFDDWEESSAEDGSPSQSRFDSRDIHGFLIKSSESSDYNQYSFYFATEVPGGISIYVLEGVSYDEDFSEKKFEALMNTCIGSIRINNQ